MESGKLKTKCPACGMPISFAWKDLNSRVVKFHTVECAWCERKLTISKKWMAFIALCIFTLPLGALGLLVLPKINALQIANEV